MAVLALPIAMAAGASALGYGFGTLGFAAAWVGGSILSNYFFAEKARGPELAPIHVSQSSYGVCIPLIWGRMRVGGSFVWPPGDQMYTSHQESSSGKGGPRVTTQTLTTTFRIVLCRSRGTHSVLRIWNFGELIYDARGAVVQGSDLPFVFYNGASDQMPDPTEESITGVGMVPAYRGVLSMVATDWDITKWGGLQLNFEVESGDGIQQEISRLSTWADDAFEDLPTPGLTGSHAPSVDYDGEHIRVSHYLGAGAGDTAYSTNGDYGQWITDRYTENGTFVDTTTVDVVAAPGLGDPFAGSVFKCREDSEVFFMRWNDGAGHDWGIFYRNGLPIDQKEGAVAQRVVDASEFVSMMHSNGQRAYYMLGGITGDDQCIVRRMFGPEWDDLNDPTYIITGQGNGSQFDIYSSTDGHVYVNRTNMSGGSTDRLWKFDEDLSLVQTYDFATTAQFAGRNQVFFCGDLCVYYHQVSPGNYEVRVAQVAVTTPWTVVSQLSYAPGVNAGAPDFAVVGPFNLENGLAFVQDGMLSVCEIARGRVLLKDIVAPIHEECGQSSAFYDVEELLDEVHGFGLFEVMMGRAAIESLMPLFAFDGAQIDGQIVYKKRGRQSDITVPNGDLAGRGENEEIPDRLQLIRGNNDEELPSLGYIKYFNVNADYQIGTQPWRRSGTGSKVTITLNAAIAFTDAEAKARIDWYCENLWNDRNAYIWSTTRKYLRHTPLDVMTVEGIPLHVRKVRERQAEGVMVFEGVRVRPGLYVSSGVGGESEGMVPSEIPEAQETDAEILDIPLIADINRQSVVHVGMQGALRRSWRGASLQKSVDGGASYDQVLVQTSPDSMGVCVSKLQNYGGPGPDEANVLRVRMGPGAADLESITDTAMMNGAGWCAIGASGGAYEMARYRTATLIDEEDDGSKVYDVSGFLRGRRGTRHYMKAHEIGDRFIALPTNTVLDGLRTDFGRTRHYKAVTLGRTLATADVIPFRSNAISLTPFAPVDVAAGFIGSSTIRLQWDRRTRLGFGWIPGIEQPLGEEEERYQIRIYEDGTKQTVVNTYESTTTYFDYTSAMQTADFGGALDVFPAWNVRQKGLVGWGYDSDGQLSQLMPEDFPGYVPPNPDPGDTTYFVNSTMPYVSGSQVSAPSLEPNQTWAIAVTVGATPTTLNDLVGLATADGPGGAPVPRIWTFSPIKGDFAPQSTPYSYNLEGSPYPSVQFQVINNTNPGYPVVPSWATWYLNIRTLPTSYTVVPLLCNISNVP